MYLLQPFLSFTYSRYFSVYSSSICWMCKVLVHSPDWIKVPFLNVMVLISSLHSSFSWLCRLVTGHSKEILGGCVGAFRYSVFSFIPYLVVMHTNEYTLSHIQKQSIHLNQFWVKFLVLVINSISNIYYSFWVDSISGVLIYNLTPSFQIPFRNI